MSVNGHADEHGRQEREHVRLNQDDDDLERRDERRQRQREHADAHAGGRPELLIEDEHERQDRQDGDVAAGHVGGKTHREREGAHQHAHDLDRDQEQRHRQRQAVRHHVLPVLHETVRARAGDDDGEEGDGGKRRGHVEVAGGGDATVRDLGEERILGGVDDGVIEQRQHVEDRDQADGVGGENEQEQGEQQRRVGIHPLVADVGTHDRLLDEVDGGFQRVHEPGGDEPLLVQIAPHRQHHRHEDQGGDDPEHQDMLGDRHVHAHDRRQVNQRVLQRTVGDVLDDRHAGVEGLGGVFPRGLGGFFYLHPVYSRALALVLHWRP